MIAESFSLCEEMPISSPMVSGKMDLKAYHLVTKLMKLQKMAVSKSGGF